VFELIGLDRGAASLDFETVKDVAIIEDCKLVDSRVRDDVSTLDNCSTLDNSELPVEIPPIVDVN
jgi:hypothetical protein